MGARVAHAVWHAASRRRKGRSGAPTRRRSRVVCLAARRAMTRMRCARRPRRSRRERSQLSLRGDRHDPAYQDVPKSRKALLSPAVDDIDYEALAQTDLVIELERKLILGAQLQVIRRFALPTPSAPAATLPAADEAPAADGEEPAPGGARSRRITTTRWMTEDALFQAQVAHEATRATKGCGRGRGPRGAWAWCWARGRGRC